MNQELQLAIRPLEPGAPEPLLIFSPHPNHPIQSNPPPYSIVIYPTTTGWTAFDSATKVTTPLTDDAWTDLAGWRVQLKIGSQTRHIDPTDASHSFLEESSFPLPFLRISDAGADDITPRRVDLEFDSSEVIVIGRRAGPSGIRLLDRHVSREHLRLVLRGTDVWLENVSQYPPRVNGKETKHPTRLRHGDRIDIGNSTISFSHPMGEESQPATDRHSIDLMEALRAGSRSRSKPGDGMGDLSNAALRSSGGGRIRISIALLIALGAALLGYLLSTL